MLSALLGLLGFGGVGAIGYLVSPVKTINLLTTAWEWICHRSFWQITTAAALVFATWQTVHISGFHFWFIRIAGLEQQLADARAQRDALKHQLDGITAAKDTQRTVTRTNVETVTRIIHDADRTARAIEQASVLPGCQTPKAVLDADI